MNSIGSMFRVTTWGESHGRAMGAVIDGCPAGLPLDEKDISEFLKKADRPVEVLATKRKEQNNANILSGLDNGRTIGTPLSIVIENTDYRRNDYSDINSVFRPGHGDYSWHLKHNIPPQSGGGRASGRECISRLAAGYVAKKVLSCKIPEFAIESRLVSLAGVKINDEITLQTAINRVLEIAAGDDSTGGEIELIAIGIPGGLGEPVFRKLDADLAAAFMSIGGVKAVEIGLGREAAFCTGSQCNDGFSINKGNKGVASNNGSAGFSGNNAGGILSGISSGSNISVRLSVKPTPSIPRMQTGLGMDGALRQITVNGRHDLNISPRVAVIAESMACLVLLDHLMIRGLISRDSITMPSVPHEQIKEQVRL